MYALVVLLGPMNFGYIMGFTSPAIPEFQNEWTVTKLETTAFNAISSLFAIGGPFIATWLLGYLGRRPTLCIISASCAVFWACLLATSEKLFWFGVAIRALLGLCVGAYSSLCPMYLVELAPKEITGFFGGLNQCGIVLGIIFMYLQGNWRSWWTLCITGIVTCVVQCALVWAIPETAPEKKVDTDNNDQDEKDTLWQKKYVGKLLIGIAMMFFQQFCGVNALITNLDENFRDAGVPVDSGIASTISVAAQLLAVVLGGFLVDWLGRRLLWCVSSAGCAICLFIFAMNSHYDWADWLPILVIFLYMFFFGAAMGPVPWYVIPELFPHSVRSLASSMISMSNWVCAFIVIFLYPWMKSGIGNIWSLVIFGLITVVGCIFGVFFITEPPKDKGLDWNENDSA